MDSPLATEAFPRLVHEPAHLNHIKYAGVAQEARDGSTNGPSARKRRKTIREHYEECKVVLNKTISGRFRDGQTGYDDVGALLLSWKDSDLDRKEREGERLHRIFEDRFRFKTTTYQIPSEKAMSGLNAAVAKFAEKHDSPDKLAIVYYGGHGSHENGRLKIHAREEGNGDVGDPEAFFEQVIDLLKILDSDILIITDCCFAARAFANLELGLRKFELFVAVPPDQLARPPGPQSFTRHLCDALETLSEEKKGFSTSSLYRKVYFAQEDNRKPFLFDQSKVDYGRIWLQPLPPPAPHVELANGTLGTASAVDHPTAAVEPQQAPATFLHIKLELNSCPDPVKMNELARHMQYLPHVKDMKFEHLHGGVPDMQAFILQVTRAAKLRPLLARVRLKIDARKREIAVEAANNNSDSKAPPLPGFKRKASDRFNWDNSKIQEETTFEKALHRYSPIKAATFIDAEEQIQDAQATAHVVSSWLFVALQSALLAALMLYVFDTFERDFKYELT